MRQVETLIQISNIKIESTQNSIFFWVISSPTRCWGDWCWASDMFSPSSQALRRHTVLCKCCSMYKSSLTPGQSDSHIALAVASLSPRLTPICFFFCLFFFLIPSTNKTRVRRGNSSASHPQQCPQCCVLSQKIIQWSILIFISWHKCQDAAFLFLCPFQPTKPAQLFSYIFIVKTSWYAWKHFVTEQLMYFSLCIQRKTPVTLRKNQNGLLKCKKYQCS